MKIIRELKLAFRALLFTKKSPQFLKRKEKFTMFYETGLQILDEVLVFKGKYITEKAIVTDIEYNKETGYTYELEYIDELEIV